MTGRLKSVVRATEERPVIGETYTIKGRICQKELDGMRYIGTKNFADCFAKKGEEGYFLLYVCDPLRTSDIKDHVFINGKSPMMAERVWPSRELRYKEISEMWEANKKWI